MSVEELTWYHFNRDTSFSTDTNGETQFDSHDYLHTQPDSKMNLSYVTPVLSKSMDNHDPINIIAFKFFQWRLIDDSNEQ